MKTWNNKCINKAECNNEILLKATNQTDPRIKKNWHWTYRWLCVVIGLIILCKPTIVKPAHVVTCIKRFPFSCSIIRNIHILASGPYARGPPGNCQACTCVRTTLVLASSFNMPDILHTGKKVRLHIYVSNII